MSGLVCGGMCVKDDPVLLAESSRTFQKTMDELRRVCWGRKLISKCLGIVKGRKENCVTLVCLTK